MRLDLYARVSTEDQDVEQQILELRRWTVSNNHEIASETYDKQSAKIPLEEREQFMKLINNPKGQALLVFNLDRLTRNWDSVTFIEKHFRDSWDKYKLISTKDDINLETSNGRLMFRIKLAVNCHMPEDMLEKQAIGIARAKAQGKFKGRKKGAVAKKMYSQDVQSKNGIHSQQNSNIFSGCEIGVKRAFKIVYNRMSSVRGHYTFN